VQGGKSPLHFVELAMTEFEKTSKGKESKESMNEVQIRRALISVSKRNIRLAKLLPKVAIFALETPPNLKERGNRREGRLRIYRLS
jgi:hypothetical protein